VWVYRSDIVSANGVAPGTAVGVTDERGKFLGTALYSSASQIAVRMISPRPVDDLSRLLRERIQGALRYRERVVRDTDAYRVIFSEADFLPGLIVDRYNDVLSMQILTQAMDAEAVRETARYLGIGITGLINGLDPEVVVIGGEITKAWGLIEPIIVEETKRSLLAPRAYGIAIRRSAFEVRPSLKGALTLIQKDLLSVPHVG